MSNVGGGDFGGGGTFGGLCGSARLSRSGSLRLDSSTPGGVGGLKAMTASASPPCTHLQLSQPATGMEMRQRGIVPEVIAYSAVISALEKGRQPDQALEIFMEM